MTRLAAWMAIGVLALAACGGGDDDGEAQSGDTEWANNICQAADDVGSSLSGLTDAIKVDTNNPSNAVEEAKGEMSDRLESVQQSVEDLAKAIGDLPAGTDAEIQSAAGDLSDATEQLHSNVDNLSSAASKVADANNVQELTAALPAASAALKSTQNSLSAITTDISGYVDSADQALKQAFDDAEACQSS